MTNGMRAHRQEETQQQQQQQKPSLALATSWIEHVS